MKLCLACNETYAVPSSEAGRMICPNCGNETPKAHGMPLYAPEFSEDSEGFQADFFESLARMEGRNFWFRARNRILTWAFKKYAAPFENLLEVGCGTGFVLTGLQAQFPNAHLSGSEIFLNGLRFAAERLPEAELMQMDARRIPYRAHFDAVGAFDVLEHIKEDETVLAEIYAALKPGGTLVVSVPQHMWLWSAPDTLACHVRRYARGEMEAKMQRAGFKVARSTSFVSFLLPPMMLSRWLQRNTAPEELDTSAEMELNPLLNTIFYAVLRLELACIRAGLSFPLGGSRLVIAHKPH